MRNSRMTIMYVKSFVYYQLSDYQFDICKTFQQASQYKRNSNTKSAILTIFVFLCINHFYVGGTQQKHSNKLVTEAKIPLKNLTQSH